ncbi:MAG: DHHA1 domain-containing protein [Candidatus Azambacteria bacterium]|nr:DHHA1 domain-containing protein [Candidatus Azambacteria bacterium]
MKPNKLKSICVLYHAECSDGFTAAWAAWKKFGSKVDYIPIKLGNPPPPEIKDRIVYTLDFTYYSPYLEKFMKDNKRVVAIDHHISAKNFIKKVPEHVFDIEHSGAVLAFKYFHPNKKIPRMVRIVEESDLWKFKSKNVKEVFAYIRLLDFDFKIYDNLISLGEKESNYRKYVEKGTAIILYEDKIIENMIRESAYPVIFEGHKIYAINAPRFLRSKIGMQLSKKYPPFSLVWVRDKNRIEVSLRSNGGLNVSEIALKFGGGGHPNAAGFSIPANFKFPWKDKK